MDRMGQRVWIRNEDPERTGVVVASEFDGSPARQELLIRWDCGATTWEMGEDCRRVANVPGDAFYSMHNGFGVRNNETSPDVHVNDKPRDSNDVLALLQHMGLRDKPKTLGKDEQARRDVLRRTSEGVPMKGGVNQHSFPRHVSQERLDLAKQGDQFMLVADPETIQSVWPKHLPAWAKTAKDLERGKIKTRAEKRKAKRNKRKKGRV